MSDLATIQADVRALVLATGLPVITFSEAELGVGRVEYVVGRPGRRVWLTPRECTAFPYSVGYSAAGVAAVPDRHIGGFALDPAGVRALLAWLTDPSMARPDYTHLYVVSAGVTLHDPTQGSAQMALPGMEVAS